MVWCDVECIDNKKQKNVKRLHDQLEEVPHKNLNIISCLSVEVAVSVCTVIKWTFKS